jgi:hypothetical protein
MMEGYKKVFDHAEQSFQNLLTNENNTKEEKEIFHVFDSFRKQNDLYGFLINGDHNGDYPPDKEAMAIAIKTNPVLYTQYVKRNSEKQLLGYNGVPITTFSYYNQLDTRHIMMSILLFHYIPSNSFVSIPRIVEIGGGFGNWVWLNHTIQNFEHWTIIDLPHVLRLQQWYLEKQGLDKKIYTLLSAYDVNHQNDNNYDIAIGAHSLSEFSFDVFMGYFVRILSKCKYIFYAHHVYGPTPQLNQQKLDVLSTTFDEIVCIPSENNMVMNRIYKNKVIKL